MVTVPAVLPTTTLDAGTAYVVDLAPLLVSPATSFGTSGKLPFGLSFKSGGTSATTIQGTSPRTGRYSVTLTGRDGAGDFTDQVETLTVNLVAPGVPNVDAAPTLAVPPGEPVAIILQPLRSSGTTTTWKAGAGTVFPPGLAFDRAIDATYLTGTPTETGTWTLELVGGGEPYGDPTGDTASMVLTVGVPVVTIPAPAAESTVDGYTLPDVAGVRWLVDGVETAPGSYSVAPVLETVTVTIVPEALDGYVLDPEAVPLVLTFTPEPAPPEPAPSDGGPGPVWPAPATPAPTPEDEASWDALLADDPQALYVATRLAARVVKHAGATTEDSDLELAGAHVMTVLEYVRGYTRDRGFSGYIPHRSLAAVIVAASARLYVNPEQLSYYQTGDYSERPATMAGWTIAELGVLRRFRRVFA